jgi:UDP-N-acetylmuramate-alanine ligase
LKNQTVHFIGIGGISMSALALMLKSFEVIVQGSDDQENEETLKLQKRGVKVFLGHSKKNLKGVQMEIIAKLNELKHKVELAKGNYERAKGRMEAADKALADAGFESVIGLENTIKDYDAKLKDLYTKLEQDTEAFIAKYGDLLK